MTIRDPAQIENFELHFRPSNFAKKIVAWYQETSRDLPWRSRWEQDKDPYTVWVSEIMLQQTVIKAVIPSFGRFLEAFPTVFDLAKAEESDVRLASRGLGYYRRFAMLHKAANIIAEQQGRWPQDFTGWKQLPGIGDYTAAAISSICYNQAVPVVDGNVERVFCRIFDIRLQPNLAKLKRRFFDIGLKIIPKESPGDYNQGVMELGQTVCLKQNPLCEKCPVASLCLAKKNSSQSLAPQKKQKIEYEDIAMRLVIPVRKGRIGLYKRSAEAKFLKNTWGFQTLIQNRKDRTFRWDGDSRIVDFKDEESVGLIRHSITKHRIQSEVLLNNQASTDDIRWLAVDEVEAQLVSNLDRKAFQLLN